MLPLPSPYTPTIESALYKQQPSDFVVNEQLTIAFSETGEHLWLNLQKTGLNTNFVAKLLAQWAHIPIKDVGFSGLKDRHAVTTQWFSLRLPQKQAPQLDFANFVADKLAASEHIQVLEQHWHHKKLGRGSHQANQFIITLQEVIGNRADIGHQLALIQTQGVPNYFGEQRFGHAANNLTAAIELFEHQTLNGKKIHRKYDQDKISLYLSAARSEIFNAILAKRVTVGNWQTPKLGDVMNLAGSNSIFVPDHIDDTLLQRLAAGDIHLTGAMWGEGNLKSFGDIAALERQVIADNPAYQQLAAGLIAFGLKQQRRPLRLLAKQLAWHWQDEHTLVLDFILPRGSFATTLLASLIAPTTLPQYPQ